MNRERRKKIREIVAVLRKLHSAIEDLHIAEQQSYSSIPWALQSPTSEVAVMLLHGAERGTRDVIGSLVEAHDFKLTT